MNTFAKTFILSIPFFALSLYPATLSADPIIMEAEHADAITLNYEIHEHEGASGGLAISTKEGSGGDFPYYETPVKDINIGTALFTVQVPRDGRYVLGVRAFWMDKCGNQVWAKIDSRKAFHISSPDKAPDTFKKWYWETSKTPVLIPKGVHTIELHVGEDGSAIDQVGLFSEGDTPDNESAEKWDMLFREKPASPFSLSISKPSELIDEDGTRSITLCIRKMVQDKASGILHITGPDDMKVLPESAIPFEMGTGEVLKQISATVLFPSDTARSEKKITVTVSDSQKTVCTAVSCIFARPFDWHVIGTFSPMVHLEAQVMLGNSVSLKEELLGKSWTQVPRKAMNPYQTIDFEQIYGQSVSVCAYLYTEITVPETGRYLVLVNNDGAVQVWIGGQERVTDLGHHPAAGWLKQPYIHLEKGTHPVLVRCEQNSVPEDGFQANYWLFRLRFRERRNVPSEIAGAECVKK